MTGPLKMYGIKNCDTIKKARTWLNDHNIEFEFHDYNKAGVDLSKLKHWSQQVGWESLLNRRGTTWRKLDDAVRDNIDEASALKIMEQQPSIIKRPVLETDDKILVGFNASEYQSLT